jgi:hypothetical protein
MSLLPLPALAALAEFAPAAALATFPGDNGVVAYSAGVFAAQGLMPDGLWALDPQSGDQRQLTSGDDTWPSFSPSGNALVFQRGSGAGAMIYLAQADGANATPLLAGEEPSFSPDGQQIVFVRPAGLFLAGIAAGSAVTQLTDGPGDRAPQWGPSGMIVFVRRGDLLGRGHGKGKRLVVLALSTIDPPSSRVGSLAEVSPPLDEFAPAWSARGQNVTADLCTNSSLRTRVGTVSLTLSSGCAPGAPAPEGKGWAEADAGRLLGSEQGCPEHVYRSGISWQPVLAGTTPIATSPCSGQRLGSGPLLEEEPQVGAGSKVCLFSRRRRRFICHTVG